MKYITGFFKFWYHFIVGDEWRIALGVGLSFCLIYTLVHRVHANVWWLLPILVTGLMSLSLWLETRRRP